MPVDYQELKAQCQGRWYGILETLGISVPKDPSKHVACPICGPGQNSHRFRFDNKNGSGSWICTQCGSSNGFGLVSQVLGTTFPDTLQRISEVVGMYSIDKDSKTTDQGHKKDPSKFLRDIYKSSIKLNGKDLASRYLRSRGLVVEVENLMYCDECYEPETKSKMHAMIGNIQNHNGDYIGMHRTFLNQGGSQADLKSSKKLMPAKEPLAGSAVRLFKTTDTVGVAEGIETSIAARQLFDIPVWACISSTLLEGFKPPKEIRKVVVFGDNDSNYTGQKAAYRLANRLYNKPFELIVDVQIPDTPGDDWADVLERNKS